MVEIQSKNGATYLRAYQQLVERTKGLDGTSVDQDMASGQVLVDQVVQAGVGFAQEDTRLLFKGSLASGPVLAPSGPVSVEGIPLEEYSQQPASKLSFRPSGGKLQVEESWFAAGKTQGVKRTFTVNFSDKAISGAREEAITRTLPGAAEPAVQRELSQLGSEISSLAYTIQQSRFDS